MADGTTYIRLTGAALRDAVVGKSFCIDRGCSNVAGTNVTFFANGNWSIAGDRWDDGGKCRVTNTLVLLGAGNESPPTTYAFYRSDSGVMRQAWENDAVVRSAIVYVRTVEP